MSILIRRATAADQPAIHALIRQGRINPLHTKWPNFIVAERVVVGDRDYGAGALTVLGVGQLRPYQDGSVELASLVVDGAHQKQGIGRSLVQTLISLARSPLYLMCDSVKVPYYRRFGFEEVFAARVLPREMGQLYRLGRRLLPVLARLSGKRGRLAVMAYPQVHHLP